MAKDLVCEGLTAGVHSFDVAPVAARVEALLNEQVAPAGKRSERAAALAGRTRNALMHLALAQVGAAEAMAGQPGSIGLIAMSFAYSPPALITVLYSIAIGMLSAGLFVPVVAGLWWRRADDRQPDYERCATLNL